MLSDHHQRRGALATEVRQQLVKLGGKELLLGHRIHVTIEAVNDDHPRAVLLDGAAN
jgi:hypothetical protein